MSAVVGDTITARLAEVDKELKDVEATVAPLRAEKKALEKSLAIINGATGSTNGKTDVSNEQIVAFVANAGKAVTSKEIAEGLGTTPRHLGRKLRKLADDGTIGGDKDAGFTPAAA